MKKQKLYQRPEPKFLKLKLFLMSLVDPVSLVIDKNAESILDIACGQGLPMRKIRARINVRYAVGVDIYKPYLEECRLKKLHNEYMLKDIRKTDFKDKSFDIVLALQVLEHMDKKESWDLLKKLEKIAKKQVIISMPIGLTHHDAVDENEHQLHKSAFFPEELEKKGYRVIQMGVKGLLGKDGLEGKIKNPILHQLVFLTSMIVDGTCLFFPRLGNYYFVAEKKVR